MPQLRQNPITGDWVVIAPERAKRPSDFVVPKQEILASHSDCPFCLSGPAYQERVAGYETERVYLTPNKYPAFIANPTEVSDRSITIKNNFYRARPATGGHDIVVIKDTNVSIMSFPKETWVALLTISQSRSLDFRHHRDVEITMPIYNHRPAAGASIDHPHAQLFATNTVPNQLTREVHSSFSYFERERRCVFCDLIHHEQEFRSRIIVENDTFVAFTFYAARFPFEVWILPKVHHDRFETADSKVINDLSSLLPTIFERYDQTLNDPPLNFWIHSLPNSLDQAEYFHWHLEIAPRLTNYGGFELGSGVIIDIVSPEHAAEFLLVPMMKPA